MMINLAKTLDRWFSTGNLKKIFFLVHENFRELHCIWGFAVVVNLRTIEIWISIFDIDGNNRFYEVDLRNLIKDLPKIRKKQQNLNKNHRF